jgi:hypothetical protein
LLFFSLGTHIPILLLSVTETFLGLGGGRLEAFDPNGRCVYTRVLVAVESNDLIRPVWLYNYKFGHNAERIASGCWYPSK